jgi:hypothetical protein
MKNENSVPVTFTITVEMSEEVDSREIKDIGQSIAHAVAKQAQEFGLTMESEAYTQEVTVYNVGGSIVGYENIAV